VTKNPLLVPGLLSLSLWGCSFGDRSVLLTIERPLGDPQIPRGISVVLEKPQDRRPEPHDVVGSVRSGVGVKTADIFSDKDVREWIHQAMTQELQHAGFLVISSPKRGLALRVTTEIRDLSCEEGIGFRGRMTLQIRVQGDSRMLLDKTYAENDRHLLITKTSGQHAADSLRTCLREIMSQFTDDFVNLVERDPE
jgi:hypothetical protein